VRAFISAVNRVSSEVQTLQLVILQPTLCLHVAVDESSWLGGSSGVGVGLAIDPDMMSLLGWTEVNLQYPVLSCGDL